MKNIGINAEKNVEILHLYIFLAISWKWLYYADFHYVRKKNAEINVEKNAEKDAEILHWWSFMMMWKYESVLSVREKITQK